MKMIKDFPGYAISMTGRVWSMSKKGTGGHDGKWILSHINNRGYKCINLCKNGRVYNKTIHRIVAKNYLDNSDNLPIVEHLDDNKLNNSLDNLKWSTQKNNIQGAWKRGRMENTRKAYKKIGKLGMKKIKCIETKITYNSVIEAELKTGFVGLGMVCNKKRKTAGGYHWEWI